MSWLTIATLSYFLAAVVVATDKFLLEQKVRRPLIFAFYAGILNTLILFAWPLDFSFVSLKITIVAFVAGAAFLAAIFFFFTAVKRGEISRVVAFIGGVSPLFLLIFSHVFLAERLPVFWLVSLFLLVSGSFILAFEKSGKVIFFYSFVASFFFALTFFCTKLVFLETSFINGFLWTRVGTAFSTVWICIFLFLKDGRQFAYIKTPRKTLFFFVFVRALGGLAFGGLNYAIKLGPVALINALQGTEYVFIFFISLFLSRWRPNLLKERFSFKESFQKVAGIILVSAGVFLLFFF